MADTSETAGRAVVALGIVRTEKSIQLLVLAMRMKLTAHDAGRVVGWLEREGKVSVSKDSSGQAIVSVADGVPTY
jgi:hypothetical protein